MTNSSVLMAQVMAHCGGDPKLAVEYLGTAIADNPADPESYSALADLHRTEPAETDAAVEAGGSPAVVAAFAYVAFLKGDMDNAVMALGSVAGHRPDIGWADAPWFSEARPSADALAEAVLRIMDGGRDLGTDGTRGRLRPWMDAIDVVSVRDPRPEAMANMARFLRACGLADAALSLCDRADDHGHVMMTEVVRGGTWRMLGDVEQAAAAFERAVELEPDNWSLYLDLADLRAEQGDYAAAVAFADKGLVHEPDEVTLLAARAAYDTRLSGTDLAELIELAPLVENPMYRARLIECACEGPGLSRRMIKAAQRAKG